MMLSALQLSSNCRTAAPCPLPIADLQPRCPLSTLGRWAIRLISFRC